VALGVYWVCVEMGTRGAVCVVCVVMEGEWVCVVWLGFVCVCVVCEEKLKVAGSVNASLALVMVLVEVLVDGGAKQNPVVDGTVVVGDAGGIQENPFEAEGDGTAFGVVLRKLASHEASPLGAEELVKEVVTGVGAGLA
jgi:hypothetical protein